MRGVLKEVCACTMYVHDGKRTTVGTCGGQCEVIKWTTSQARGRTSLGLSMGTGHGRVRSVKD